MITRLIFATLLLGIALGGLARETTDTRAVSSAENATLAWGKLPPIPDAAGQAGMFAGQSGGALIAAGGANFPRGKPWEDGVKVWSDAIYVLPDGATEWQSGFSLPGPRGYGVSVSTPRGVICIGGSDADEHFAQVFALRWTGDAIEIDELPPLPVPVANGGGALVGETIYVVAGSESPVAPSASPAMFALDLADVDAGWRIESPLPGPGRILPAVGSVAGSLYVFSGAALKPGPGGKVERTYLTDAWKFTPGSGWTALGEMPRATVAAPVIVPRTPGNSSLLIVGGDDGSLAHLPASDDHPGFPDDILVYNPTVDQWSAGTGDVAASVVTAPVVDWDDGASVIVSGEVRPGVRTPEVQLVSLAPPRAKFGFWNYAALAVYLLGIFGIGVGFSGSNETSDDYFRGGQKIPWWAAGLSIFATTLSSITFMAVPAKAYSEDWVFSLANLPILLIAPFIIYMILPVFRRIDATSAYEYLERRFNLAMRLFGSAAFVIFQIGRMAIVMFLPALALATVTDFDIYTCIIVMGVLTVIYCVLGGISAVVWTDVVQSVVFFGGALLTLLFIIGKTDGGLGEFFNIARANEKLKLINWTWDYTVASLWVIVIGNIFSNMIVYASDQGTIQRYMTTETEAKAARSIWLNGLVAIPATILFFAVGTALYVYYYQNPDRFVTGTQNDAIFPLFIARELPVGMGGLLVASVFAAAQSTISTSMNSISTVVVTDWYERLRKQPPTDKQKLRLARWLTAWFGVIGTLGALWLAVSDIYSAWDVFLKILGLTGSALAGLFLLGIFSRRANGFGAVAGAVSAVVVLAWVQKYTNVHFFLYAVIGIVTCFGVGWIASLAKPAPSRESLRGLTYQGMRDDRKV